MSKPIIIYGHPVSPFVRKALIALEVKGVRPSSIVPLTPVISSDALKDISPLRRIPVFQQGDFTLPDSSVIAEFLDESLDGAALYPTDSKIKAKARWFEEYIDTHIAQYFVFQYFFEKLVKPSVLKLETDDARVKAAEEKMPEILAYVEENLTEAGYLLGDTPYMPDFAIGFMFQNAGFAGWQCDAGEYPKTVRLLSALNSHAGFKKVSQLGADLLTARRQEIESVLKAYLTN